MSIHFNTAGSDERFVSPTTLSLSTSSVTFCGRAIAAGDGTVFTARIGAGTTAAVVYTSGGTLNFYNGTTITAIGSEPSAGTAYFWYCKLTGGGAGQVLLGIHPDGGSLTTTTATLANTGTIDRMWVGGDPFDPCDVKLDSFKVFASLLSAGDLVNERTTYDCWTAPYIWLPMTAGTVAACALDSSGNALDFTVNGSPAVIATPASGYHISGAAGSFALTGQTAGLKRGLKCGTAVGAFSFTGQAATLIDSGSGAYTLVAAGGSFSLGGQTAGLKATRRLAAATGAYALTGQSATLRVPQHLTMAAETGTFMLSGTAATLSYSADDGWAPVDPVAETWAPVAETPETWSAA